MIIPVQCPLAWLEFWGIPWFLPIFRARRPQDRMEPTVQGPLRLEYLSCLVIIFNTQLVTLGHLPICGRSIAFAAIPGSISKTAPWEDKGIHQEEICSYVYKHFMPSTIMNGIVDQFRVASSSLWIRFTFTKHGASWWGHLIHLYDWLGGSHMSRKRSYLTKK